MDPVHGPTPVPFSLHSGLNLQAKPSLEDSLQSEMKRVIPILATNRERTKIDLRVQGLRRRQEKAEDNARNVRRRNGNGKTPIPQTPQTRRQRLVEMP